MPYDNDEDSKKLLSTLAKLFFQQYNIEEQGEKEIIETLIADQFHWLRNGIKEKSSTEHLRKLESQCQILKGKKYYTFLQILIDSKNDFVKNFRKDYNTSKNPNEERSLQKIANVFFKNVANRWEEQSVIFDLILQKNGMENTPYCQEIQKQKDRIIYFFMRNTSFFNSNSKLQENKNEEEKKKEENKEKLTQEIDRALFMVTLIERVCGLYQIQGGNHVKAQIHDLMLDLLGPSTEKLKKKQETLLQALQEKNQYPVWSLFISCFFWSGSHVFLFNGYQKECDPKESKNYVQKVKFLKKNLKECFKTFDALYNNLSGIFEETLKASNSQTQFVHEKEIRDQKNRIINDIIADNAISLQLTNEQLTNEDSDCIEAFFNTDADAIEICKFDLAPCIRNKIQEQEMLFQKQREKLLHQTQIKRAQTSIIIFALIGVGLYCILPGCTVGAALNIACCITIANSIAFSIKNRIYAHENNRFLRITWQTSITITLAIPMIWISDRLWPEIIRAVFDPYHDTFIAFFIAFFVLSVVFFIGTHLEQKNVDLLQENEKSPVFLQQEVLIYSKQSSNSMLNQKLEQQQNDSQASGKLKMGSLGSSNQLQND